MPTSTGSALVLVSPPVLPPPLASVGAQAASARLAPEVSETAYTAARAMLGIEQDIRSRSPHLADAEGLVAEAATRSRLPMPEPAPRHPALGR